MLERKDLVKGQYYRYWYDRDYYHIGKCLISNKTNAIGIWGNTIDLEKFDSFTMDGRFGASNSYELATKEEIEWLDYCIEKGKFIPKKEVKSNSLIGRYLKALVNKPVSIGLAKKGDYFIILDDFTDCKSVKDNVTWSYKNRSEEINPEIWELMPVGFSPNQIDSIPEYVECVNAWHKDWTTGKIYKTEETQKYFPTKLTVRCDKDVATHVENWDVRKGVDCGFKISTKEAFEAQNKTIIQQKPMETNNEFKVGDWVIGWHANYKKYQTEAWQIEKITASQLVPKNDPVAGTIPNNIKRAELHQIPTKDLSNEELLSIAKTYYSEKTVVNSLVSGFKNMTITHKHYPTNDGGIWFESDCKLYNVLIYKDGKWAEIISSPNEIKEIKPSVKVSDEIEIGDEVECNHGKGIVLAISEIGNYLVNGKTKSGHTGGGGKLKKGKISDKYDSWYYNLSELKLIKKANNTTTLIQTKKDDVLSPKVENKVTVQIIERKIKNPILNISVQEENQNIFVPLIQKETKKINNITIKNFSLTI